MTIECIYKIANTVNDSIYVGHTHNLHKRWLKHVNDAMRGSTKPVHTAMREIGIEHFYAEVIEDSLEYTAAHDRETYWIRILDTVYPQGYNASAPLLTSTEAAVVKYDAWGWTLHQYAHFFGASVLSLQQVRQGASHFHVTKKHLPVFTYFLFEG
jgi:predicted GIY-YIG superfamily endonuclease